MSCATGVSCSAQCMFVFSPDRSSFAAILSRQLAAEMAGCLLCTLMRFHSCCGGSNVMRAGFTRLYLRSTQTQVPSRRCVAHRASMLIGSREVPAAPNEPPRGATEVHVSLASEISFVHLRRPCPGSNAEFPIWTSTAAHVMISANGYCTLEDTSAKSA